MDTQSIGLTDAEIYGSVIGRQRREIAALRAQIDTTTNKVIRDNAHIKSLRQMLSGADEFIDRDDESFILDRVKLLIALRKSDLQEKKEMGERIDRLETEMIKITHAALPDFNTEEQG